MHTSRQRVATVLVLLLACLLPLVAQAAGNRVIWFPEESPYRLYENLIIPEDGSLLIEAGVHVELAADVQIIVLGEFQVSGTEANPVFFGPSDPGAPWSGIVVRGANSPFGILEYAVLEGCRTGVRVERSTFTIRHSRIQGINSAIEVSDDGDLGLFGVEAEVMSNFSGAVVLRSSRSRLAADSSRFRLTVSDPIGASTPTNLWISRSDGRITRCSVDLKSETRGVGMFIIDGDGLTLRRNSVHIVSTDTLPSSRSSAIRIAGTQGIRLDHFSIEMSCSAGLTYGIFAMDGSHVTVINSIIAGAGDQQAPHLVAAAIDPLTPAAQISMRYDCLYRVQPPTDPHIAVNLPSLVLEDPRWVDEEYHLGPGSPCIDAGDPASNEDPDGTIADIGKFFFDQTASPGPETVLLPGEFHLSPAWPNPFNATARVDLVLPRSTVVHVEVIDLLGRQVAVLASGHHPAGRLPLLWNGRSETGVASSGLYLVRATAPGWSAARRIVLLR